MAGAYDWPFGKLDKHQFLKGGSNDKNYDAEFLGFIPHSVRCLPLHGRRRRAGVRTAGTVGFIYHGHGIPHRKMIDQYGV